MRVERKKYWREGEKWFCETSYWHEDTQNCSTAFVREVPEADVPESARGVPAAPETPVSADVTTEPGAATATEAPPLAETLLAETLLPFGDAAAVIGAAPEQPETP